MPEQPQQQQNEFDSTLLEDARELQAQGLIDKLPPAKRIQLLKALQPEMAKEQSESLQPASQLVSKPKSESSFIDQIVNPIRMAIQNPGAAAESAIRGVARAFNPAPIVNMLTPGAPHIPDDLETMEGLTAFPIIRGAELTARMFVPEDQRPSLTTFAQVVNNQRQLDNELRQIVPGVQEGIENGIVLGSAAQLASQGLKAAANIAKGLPQAIKEYRAAKSVQNVKEMALRRLKIPEGPLLDSVINNPEKVLELSKKSGSDVKDLAFQLQDELETIGQNLGKRVGEFRDAAFKDTKTRIPVPDEIPQLIEALRSRTTFNGESVLPPFIEKQLIASEKAAKAGVTNPNQTMVWIDMLDGITKYGESDKVGSNIVKNANNVLMQLRGSIKSMLRQHNPQGLSEAVPIEQSIRQPGTSSRKIGQSRKEIAYQLWANADDAFSGFINESDGIIRRLQSDSGESLVSNLFGKDKTKLRDRIERSLDYMERIDPNAAGHGNAFLSRLADVKAGEKVKDVNLEVNRVLQENTNEIVRYWTQVGGEVGGLALGGPATFASNSLGQGNNTITGAGAAGGYLAGRLIGKRAGFVIGKAMANPERVLTAAMKARDLSNDARRLSKDMLYLTKNYGPESSIAFLDLIGPIPAVNELIKYSNIQTKGEKNARR